MTTKPGYVVHVVNEDDVTVDWFFGDRPFRQKVPQLILILIGWFFALLPVVITVSALRHRDDAGGWWSYPEGFELWDLTMATLGLLGVAFVLGFSTLYLVSQLRARSRNHQKTYDEERLETRLDLAEDLFASKYGSRERRLDQRNIRIQPYSDFETYELRDRYRTYGVGE